MSSMHDYFGSIAYISAVASGLQVAVYANILCSGRGKNIFSQVDFPEGAGAERMVPY